jgi:hypothetical protein
VTQPNTVCWLAADADPRVAPWFLSLYGTFRQAAELVELLGEHPWDSVRADCTVWADKMLTVAEETGLIARGKLCMSNSQRAFVSLDLGGSSFGGSRKRWVPHAYANRCAWTLTDAGRDFFSSL